MLVDAAGRPWLLEMQRKPAMGGSALANRVNGEMVKTIFAMHCGDALDDGMPPEALAKVAAGGAGLERRELAIEQANARGFERVV